MKKISLLLILLTFIVGCGTAYNEFNPGKSLKKYEYFKDTYAKIQATDKMIKSSSDRIKDFKETYGKATTWTWETKDEYNRLYSVRQGYIALYNSIVAEYNSYSSKFNWAIYKTSLPKTCVEFTE